jgi:hypothetical protein
LACISIATVCGPKKNVSTGFPFIYLEASLISFPLTLSNPIFLPTVYSPAYFFLGDKEVGGLLVIILQL